MIKKWENFLEEEVEFPLKKYTSIIRDEIFNKLKIGDNKIIIGFKNNEHSYSTNIILNLEWIYSKNNVIHGETDILSALLNNFKEFVINLTIEYINVDYDHLLSIIQHELKHIYDILYDESDENTFLKVKPINILKNEFKNFQDFYFFIHLVYESLNHELSARNTSIYNKFRWLGIYDKSIIRTEFEKTYIYKSLIRLSTFNSEDFISKFDIDELIKITNRFIEIYGDFEYIVNKDNIIKFYKYWENEFKEKSEYYMNKSEKIIDEIVKDNKPYMEKILTTKHLNFNIEDKYKNLFVKKLNKI